MAKREEIEDQIAELRGIMEHIPVDKTATSWAKEMALEVRRLEALLQVEVNHNLYTSS